MRSPVLLREATRPPRRLLPGGGMTRGRTTPRAAAFCLVLLLCSIASAQAAGAPAAEGTPLLYDPNGSNRSGILAAETANGAAARMPAETDLLLSAHTTQLASRPGIAFAKGVVIVKMTDGLRSQVGAGVQFTTGSQGLDGLLASRGLLRAERLFPWDCADGTGGECAFLRLTFPEESDLAELMDALARADGVESVEPVGVHRVDFYPDDPLLPMQWALNQSHDHDVNAPEAWDVERGDSSIIVAIVDTGVDWQHPELGGESSPFTGGSIWTNWTEFYGTPGVDDDGNGFVDDVRGWDFVTGVAEGACAGEDTETPDNDPSDYAGHGTHVSGIAAAIADNGVGVAGLAHRCKIMPLRAGWCMTTYGGVVRTDFCAQGIMYAARNGARVVNCSWNNDNSGGLSVAADVAIARGLVIVVAAGNQANQSQAANYLSTRNDCFDVAATDSNDVKFTGSSYGTWVDFSAPGDFVFSTFFNRAGATPESKHWYAWMDGTSMAAPHVSALTALLLSQNRVRNRTELRSIIASTCRPIDDLNPAYAGLLGAGRIDAYAALSLVTPPPPPKPHLSVVVSPNPFGGASSAVTFDITVAGADTASAGRRGTLLIFDVSGRAVAEIPVYGQGEQLAVTWDGGNDSSRKVGSGVYAYTAEVDGLKTKGKLVFLKK